MTNRSLESWLRAQIKAITRKSVDGVGANEDLCQAVGLDSLDTLELLASIEDHFDFLFSDDDLTQYRTIAQIKRAIEKHLPRSRREHAA